MAARKERQNSPIYQIYHCPESVPSLAPKLTRWRLNTSMCQKERQKEFYVRRIGSKQNRSRIEVNRKTPTQRGISQGCPPNFQSLYQSPWNHKHTLHLVDWYSFFFLRSTGIRMAMAPCDGTRTSRSPPGGVVLGVVHSCCEIWCLKNLWLIWDSNSTNGFHNVFLGPKIVIFMGFKPWKWGFNRSSHQKWLPKSAGEKSTKPWNGWQEPQEAESEESYSEEDRCSPRTKAFSFVDVSVAGTRVFTSKATLNQPSAS